MKSAGTLVSRLILDLPGVPVAVGRIIAAVREITSSLKVVFLAFCTYRPEESFSFVSPPSGFFQVPPSAAPIAPTCGCFVITTAGLAQNPSGRQ